MTKKELINRINQEHNVDLKKFLVNQYLKKYDYIIEKSIFDKNRYYIYKNEFSTLFYINKNNVYVTSIAHHIEYNNKEFNKQFVLLDPDIELKLLKEIQWKIN